MVQRPLFRSKYILLLRVWRKCGEAHNPCCLKSSVKFSKSVMIWGAVTSAGVGPLWFIKSKVNAAVYQEILEHFILPSADRLYGVADFLFQQEFSTCPHCQNHFQVVCRSWYYCAWLTSQHAWPEPHLESMLPGLMAFTYLGALFSETKYVPITTYHCSFPKKQTLEAVKLRHLLLLFTQMYRVSINKA